MATIIINRKNRSIEVSKEYEKKARVYGSPEYSELVQAQKDNPGFRVIAKASARKRDPLGKITYQQMEAYIKTHDDSGKQWNEFLKLRGKDDQNTLGQTTASYFEIKQWFLETYPEISENIRKRQTEIRNILNHTDERNEENEEDSTSDQN